MQASLFTMVAAGLVGVLGFVGSDSQAGGKTGKGLQVYVGIGQAF